MATFSGLPNELLYEILRLTMPEDLENFAQISKRVQEAAKPLLTDHRVLIRKYRRFRSWSNKTTSLLLRAIVTTPCIGHYVREVKVDFDRTLRNREEYTEQEIDWLYTMVAESKSLVVWTDIESEYESAAFALLLPLLPNLERLSMKDSWGLTYSWVPHVVSNAPRAARPYLTKLARVRVHENSYHTGAYIEHLRLYAALPSVKEILASDVTLSWPNNGNHLPCLASGVTKLDLLALAYEADSEAFCNFMREFPKLEAFKLKMLGASSMKASFIKDTLLSTVKTSLRKLTILADLGCHTFMGSLRGFEALTELHTNWPLLIKPDHNLKAVLPTSLHHLKLDDNKIHRASTCKKLLQDILSGNELGDLHLEDVILTMPDIEVLGNPYQRLQQYCYEQGLTLTFVHSGVTR